MPAVVVVCSAQGHGTSQAIKRRQTLCVTSHNPRATRVTSQLPLCENVQPLSDATESTNRRRSAIGLSASSADVGDSRCRRLTYSPEKPSIPPFVQPPSIPLSAEPPSIPLSAEPPSIPLSAEPPSIPLSAERPSIPLSAEPLSMPTDNVPTEHTTACTARAAKPSNNLLLMASRKR